MAWENLARDLGKYQKRWPQLGAALVVAQAQAAIGNQARAISFHNQRILVDVRSPAAARALKQRESEIISELQRLELNIKRLVIRIV